MQLSIMVCTRNRAYAITRCLDSISQSLTNAAPIDAEIVVVDNASEDGTQDAVNAWSANCSFPVRLLYEPKKGLATARNCALRSAKGDILAFTDDDCRLDENYVKDVIRHFAADTAPTLRGGRVELGDPTDLPITIKTEKTLRRWSKKIHSARYENISDCMVGCNMTMSRQLAQIVGLFDERFGAGTSIPGGEDTDYIFRAYLADASIEYVPDMVVYHHHGRRSPEDGGQLLKNYALAAGAIYGKYIFKDANLCRQFYWDVKSAFRERLKGSSNFYPKTQFPREKWLALCLLGAVRYFLSLIRKSNAPEVDKWFPKNAT